MIPGCQFCALLDDLTAAHVVTTDPHCVAVLDAAPAAPGHTLVLPRRHVEAIWDLDDETAAGLIRTVRGAAQLLRERLGPDGLTVRQNNGAASGQRIGHLHVHLVPRWTDDGHIGWPRPPAPAVDNAEVLHCLRAP